MATSKEADWSTQLKVCEKIYYKASQKELAQDWNQAFELYTKAAQSYITLAGLAPDDSSRTRVRSASRRAIERAEKIKQRGLIGIPKEPKSQGWNASL